MSEASERIVGKGRWGFLCRYPWLIGLLGLLLYGLTLNHWVTFGSLPFAASMVGWDWHPGPLSWRPSSQYPLFFLVSLPLRLLPAGWRPEGLNMVSTVSAALTLVMLARSVRILAQDRTNEQRQQVRESFGLLTGPVAYLPAIFAALLLAGQLTFWQNAVLGTGEMMDLAVFAFVILCLLEYRISQNEFWLCAFALVYGAGMANNWALVGFLPCFLLALLWIKRARILEIEPALRMAVCGGLGWSLYFLLPAIGAIRHEGTFWELLRKHLGEQHYFLARTPRYFVVIIGAQTLLPLFFASIRWSSSASDTNVSAGNLNRFLFRMVHLGLLAVTVLMFFDVKFSANPRNLGLGVEPGSPRFLPFYYVAALCVGYYSGYALVVYWKDLVSSGGRISGTVRLFSAGMLGAVCLGAVGLPVMLLLTNFRPVRAANGLAVAQFGRELARSLPPPPAIVISDDPIRLYLAMGGREALGLPDQYLFIEGASLFHPEYLSYLADRYPAFGKELADRNHFPDKITYGQAGEFLAGLSARQPVFYLHPIFGGGALDLVCQTPYRMGGFLHPRPTNLLASLDLTAPAIATNQAYWRAMETGPLASLRLLAQSSDDARRITGSYSQLLDNWGTELQKMGTRRKSADLLEAANGQFDAALRVNPNNVVARANQEYNAFLRKAALSGKPVKSSDVAVQFYNRWDVVLAVDGPVDAPDLELQVGRFFAQRGGYLQGAMAFQRCLELQPGDLPAELDLANCYIDMGVLNAAAALIKDMRTRAAGNPLDLAGVEALAAIATNDYTGADELLVRAQARHPGDAAFPGVMAEIYRYVGLRILRQSEMGGRQPARAGKDASVWFKKALDALDEGLKGYPIITANQAEINLLKLRRADVVELLAKQALGNDPAKNRN